MLCKIIFGLLLIYSVAVKGKFKNLVCTSFDKDYGQFVNCRIKAINRYKNSINIHYVHLLDTGNAMVRVEFFKRANGWRPFLYNFTINLCDFLKKPNHLVAKISYSYFKPFTTFHFSCPLKKNDWGKIENFTLDLEEIRDRFPIPTGEYAAQVSFYYKNVLKTSINGSAEYLNYMETK